MRTDIKEFTYHLRSRPFSIGTFPTNGFLKFEEDGSRYGRLYYNRSLDIEEIERFELVPENEILPFDGQKIIVVRPDILGLVEVEKTKRGFLRVIIRVEFEGEVQEVRTISPGTFLKARAEGRYTLVDGR